MDKLAQYGTDLWAKLALPIPLEHIEWRQDGKPSERDGKHFARFVPYMTAQFARARLDEHFAGQWQSTTDQLATISEIDKNGIHTGHLFVFKARVQILGVVREDVGEGTSPKGAATDAFKRACMRFGMGHELYQMENLWVGLTDGGKWAKPKEDPSTVYARKYGGTAAEKARIGQAALSSSVAYTVAVEGEMSTRVVGAPDDFYPKQETGAPPLEPPGARTTVAVEADIQPDCPVCDSRMWDNRLNKRNPKAPDWKCRERGCEGVIWKHAEWLEKAKKAAPLVTKESLDEDGDDLPF